MFLVYSLSVLPAAESVEYVGYIPIQTQITEYDLYVLRFCGVVRNIISDYNVMFCSYKWLWRLASFSAWSISPVRYSATEPKTVQNANNES